MKRTMTSVVSALVLAAPLQVLAADYEIDPAHTQVGFLTKHLMVSTVKGEFGKVTGTLKYDAAKPEATVLEATIDVTSINTRDAKRDGHLKSPDFFETEKFKTATFKSKKVERAGAGRLKVTGELTIKDVTKPATLLVAGIGEAKSPWGQSVLAASATGSISRKDYGMVWNKTLDSGGVLLGDNVDLVIDAEFIKKEPAPKM